MEESEKRRERLRAMRNQAFEAEGPSNFQSPAASGVLANPLVETPTVQDSRAMPRFDYYTDPMAAYSGNKHQSNPVQSSRHYSTSTSHGGGRGSSVMQFPPPPLGPRNPAMTSYPNQAQPNYITNQRMQQGVNPHYYDSGPIRSPMAMINPPPEHQDRGFFNQSGPIRSPMTMINPPPEHQDRGFFNQSGSASSYYHSGNPSGGYNTPRPGQQWARPGNPSFGSPRGRGNWVNSSTPNPGRGLNPGPNPGRGRGRSRGHWGNNSMSPGGSGHGSGGRGIGYQGDTASPHLYRKSMVEDPWKYLQPVLWRGVDSTMSAKGLRTQELLQKLSSNSKKPRVAETFSASKSKESLADYLAAAFDEAVEDTDAS